MKEKIIKNSSSIQEEGSAKWNEKPVNTNGLTAKEDFLNEISNQDDLQLCPLIYYFIFWGEHEETDL